MKQWRRESNVIFIIKEEKEKLPMKKKKIWIFILCILIGVPVLLGVGMLGKNKFFHTQYNQLSDTDKKMLAEYNEVYEAFQTQNLWKDFDLENKTILAVSKDNFNTYLLNPRKVPHNIFSKKMDMPDDFKLQSVYRIAPIALQALQIRFDVASNFNTIGEKLSVFDNEVYFIKYDTETSFEKGNQSSHFAPFLVHESFHYYMQNNWQPYNRPNTRLNEEGMQLFEKQYELLDLISEGIRSESSKETLLDYAKQYVDVVSKRLENNEQYVLSELAHETAEGSAQYLSIQAARVVGYDFGVMYFDNVTNVPFADVFKQIEAGNLSIEFLANRMPYETGAQLCLLFDALQIPDWQEKLNAQTLDHPIYLYDVLKDYVAKR